MRVASRGRSYSRAESRRGAAPDWGWPAHASMTATADCYQHPPATVIAAINAGRAGRASAGWVRKDHSARPGQHAGDRRGAP